MVYTIIIYFARVFIIIDISNTMNIFGYMTMILISRRFSSFYHFIFDISYTEKKKNKKQFVINRSNIICTFLYIDLKIWKLIPTYEDLVYIKINVEP